ncbi:nucleoside ABC transporter membrane protein [Agrococcus baldri]|uniref:Nucleoside ABC transporter membrane protein n=1 Tax=Agrococcus baldri TaxID=153730 RepID=A0AA94HN03_9MICO|nr:ABC transporter permease [Agrococcus baldri]SFS13868.1 nucleoside ABC transporter membrane protein [Agrococcus baldri]
MNDTPRDADDPIEPVERDRPGGSPDSGEQPTVVHAPQATAVTPVATAPGATDDRTVEDDDPWGSAFRRIMGGNLVMALLAIFASLVVGGILIAATDERVQAASGYFFARPGDMLGAIWDAVFGAYSALFQGSILNFSRPEAGFATMIKPLTDTLNFATPLIAAGLGVAIAFRVGLFNIGGRGQMLWAAAAAGWVGFSFQLPPVLHVLVAIAVGIVAGAIWGAVAGALKAFTGAHEVIVTIMLNFVALWFITWMLRTPGLLQNPASNNPISPPMPDSATLPSIFGPPFILHWGFVLSVAAVIFCSWLINRSSLGFQFRAVGYNKSAALNAGMDVKRLTVLAMAFAGGFMGLAGAQQVTGAVTTGFTSGIDAGIGFDGITVALLGGSTPWGTFFAGLLFGAFKAGGFRMQAAEGVPIDIILVVQSFIVLFIAAPPLVRAMFGLPQPGKKSRRQRRDEAALKAMTQQKGAQS